MTGQFVLDPQLEKDSSPILDLEISAIRLINDANYPWLILVPRKVGLSDLIDLDPADREVVMHEVDAVSRALKALTHCDKLNVASLGNMVRQLHIHVIARFEGDAAWPGPVWGVHPAKPYPGDDRDILIEKIRDRLS